MSEAPGGLTGIRFRVVRQKLRPEYRGELNPFWDPWFYAVRVLCVGLAWTIVWWGAVKQGAGVALLVALPLIFWPYRYVVSIVDSVLRIRWLFIEREIPLDKIQQVELVDRAAPRVLVGSGSTLSLTLTGGRSIAMRGDAPSLARLQGAILQASKDHGR
jgi:hypothetical protein